MSGKGGGVADIFIYEELEGLTWANELIGPSTHSRA